MVNKQVMGRGARESLGQRTNSRLPQGRFLEGSVQEKGRTGGDTVFGGALWSHTAYKKYVHAFATLGPGALSCQMGTQGVLGPSALKTATPESGLSISVNLYSLELLFTGRRPGEASPGWRLSERPMGLLPVPRAFGHVTCQPQGVPA